MAGKFRAAVLWSMMAIMVLILTISVAVAEYTFGDEYKSGSMGPDGNVYWELREAKENGIKIGYKLAIKPKNGLSVPGRICGKKSDSFIGYGYAHSAEDWPWHSDRNDIVIVEFQKNDKGNGLISKDSLSYMFSGCTSLKEVWNIDFLDTAGTRAFQGMFKNCKSLVAVARSENVLTNDNGFAKGIDTEKKHTFFDNDNKVCYSEIVDLSSFTNNGLMEDMKDMFNMGSNWEYSGSKMKNLIFNNEAFKTREYDSEMGLWGCQIQRMLQGCGSLQNVDMSSITISPSPKAAGSTMANMFNNHPNLTTVKMSNIKIPGETTFSNMFANCTALKTVDISGSDADFHNAQFMNEMFFGCTSLTSLDVSGFGELNEIVSMQSFVNGCINLETLNIDNLDNSNIGPTNEYHDGEDSENIGAYYYGRELGLETCTSLQKLSAQKSKVWMCKNNKGRPGHEYYHAANDTDMLYFTEKQMNFVSDNKYEVTIESKRDYVDLITDREPNEHNYRFNPELDKDNWPDKGTNKNILYNLNTNGPGYLAPGVYTISDVDWPQEGLGFADSYYRIAFLGDYDPTVTYKGSNQGITRIDNDKSVWFTATVENDWPTQGNKVIELGDTPITIVYPNAVIDVNGKIHDLKVEITGMRFKDLEKIPKNPDSDQNGYGRHDPNRYVDTYKPGDGTTDVYRTILKADKNGIEFMNYLLKGYASEPWINIDSTKGILTNVLTGGSGMEIDYTVSVEKANPDTTFIFYMKDLDVAASQDWNRPNKSDACYDNLPAENVTFGLGGEAVILGEGNNTDSVQFAKHTGLRLVNADGKSAVVTTGSDPNTPWSAFTVKAAATGAQYTWTSGVACTSYALANTPILHLGEISVPLSVIKVVENGNLSENDYEFELSKGQIAIQTCFNDADGIAKFAVPLEFNYAKEQGYIDTPGNVQFYPGTSKSGNANGEGTHNTFDYFYVVKEKIPSNPKPGVKYDDQVHRIEIKISTPENDAEMAKGIKAEVIVDSKKIKDFWSEDGNDPIQVGTFKNICYPAKFSVEVIKKLNGKKAGGYEVQLIDNNQWSEELRKNVYDASEKFKENGKTIAKWKTNATDHRHTIPSYSFLAPGKYYYQLKETIPDGAIDNAKDGVTYDTKTIDVTVTVTSEGTDPENQLKANVSYSVEGSSVEKAIFENTYRPKPAQFKVDVIKKVNGIQSGAYIFELYDNNDENVRSGIRTASVFNVRGAKIEESASINGKLSIDVREVEFTKPGTYHYSLKEKNEGKTGIIYDDSTYDVEVKVTDNGAGQLVAAVTYKKGNETSAEAAVFNNAQIDPPEEEDPDKPNPFLFTFTKEWQGGEKGEITFVLYNPDGTVHHTYGPGNTQYFIRKDLSETTISFSRYMREDMDYYILEEVPKNYIAIYQNTGRYAGITDRCYNGGKIINYKMPPTGDRNGVHLLLFGIVSIIGLMFIRTLKKKDRR